MNGAEQNDSRPPRRGGHPKENRSTDSLDQTTDKVQPVRPELVAFGADQQRLAGGEQVRRGRLLVHALEHFQHRVLQDALNEATATYWLKRAEDFERARPRPGEFRGQARAEDLAEADARCAAIAQACRERAEVSLFADDNELIEVLSPRWSS